MSTAQETTSTANHRVNLTTSVKESFKETIDFKLERLEDFEAMDITQLNEFAVPGATVTIAVTISSTYPEGHSAQIEGTQGPTKIEVSRAITHPKDEMVEKFKKLRSDLISYVKKSSKG